MFLALLGSLPVIGSIVNGVLTAFFNAKVRMYMAKTGADEAVAVEAIKSSAMEAHEKTQALAVVAASPLLMATVIIFAIPVALFEWKIIVYDILLGWGSTDPIKGQVADWANTVIWFIFGAPTALTLGRMWFSRQ